MLRRNEIRDITFSVIEKYENYKKEQGQLSAYMISAIFGLLTAFLGGIMMSIAIDFIVHKSSQLSLPAHMLFACGISLVVYGLFVLLSSYFESEKLEKYIKNKYPFISRRKNDIDL